jgi:hypothetical protein
MAVTRTYRGVYHELWTEAVAHDGGASQTITTAIPFGATENVALIDTIFTPALVVGVPVVTITPSSVAGVLQIVIANTAAPGNSVTYAVDTRYIHSVQQ